MEWKLTQDTQILKNKPKPSKSGHVREKNTTFAENEREIPMPMELMRPVNQIGPELLEYHNVDVANALNTKQVWSSPKSVAKRQIFAKIWDRRTQQMDITDLSIKGGSQQDLQAFFSTQIKQYHRRYPHAVYENIWWDGEDQKMFSNAQTYCTGLDPIEHSFCTNRTNFINQTWSPISSEMGRMLEDLTVAYNSLGQRPNAFGVTADDINSGRCYGDIVYPELRLGLCPAVNALLNQESVLIVGGGPSTNQINFEPFKDIPVWTMNNYYLNPIFEQFNNIQAACFLDEVDPFDNDKLWNFVNDRDTIVFQEITDYGEKRINHIRDSANYSTYFHTRYRSKLGVGPRLMITAILLGIKNIYFCGFDGYSVDSEDNHSFEKGKPLPNWMRNSPNPSALQRRQYVMLWDYILNHLKFKQPCRIVDISKGMDSLQYEFLKDVIR